MSNNTEQRCRDSKTSTNIVGISYDPPKESVLYNGQGSYELRDATHIHFHPSTRELCSFTFSGCRKLRNVVLNEGLQVIGNRAFMNCISLESITLPSTLTTLEYSTFSSCTSLRKLKINEGLQKIGMSSIRDCHGLKSIELPSTITEIDSLGFHHCKKLRKVVFNEGLEKIKDCAFSRCESLESITLPSTLVEIGKHAFGYCTKLREVIIHENIQKIGLERIILTRQDLGETKGVPRDIEKGAFPDCSSLERITIPSLSSRLETIIGIADNRTEVENKLNGTLDIVERRDGELFISAQSIGVGEEKTWNKSGVYRYGESTNWSRIRKDLDRVIELVAYYELKEATSYFELALWKSNLDQADREVVNRGDYRLGVPETVRESILQYLR